MKKLIVWPENYRYGFEEILRWQEPSGLHSVVFITLVLIMVVCCFVCFGKVDDVVRGDGIVRPVQNVSSVKVFSGGEIESVNYVPGQFVKSGEVLLVLNGDELRAQEKLLKVKVQDCGEKLSGLEDMIAGYEKNESEISCGSRSFKDRYGAYAAEVKLLSEKAFRMKQLYEEEKELPESATTLSDINERLYEWNLAELERKQYEADFISGLRQELDSEKLEYESAVQSLKQVEAEMKNLVLKSPVDGFVQVLEMLNHGDHVFSDENFLNIVPVDSGCRIEINIPGDRIGKVKAGQKVKMRFPAFPFSEFKGIEGKITGIQPDSKLSESGEVYFVAYADVDSVRLKDRKSVEYKITSGLEVSARIVLERQTLLYFLLKKLDMTV